MNNNTVKIILSTALIVAVVYCLYDEIEDHPLAVTAAGVSAMGLFILTGSLMPVFSKGA